MVELKEQIVGQALLEMEGVFYQSRTMLLFDWGNFLRNVCAIHITARSPALVWDFG